MIHHASLGVREPPVVAEALATMTGGTALKAPSPPFSPKAWFVVAGDEHGSFLEILPSTVVLDPSAPFGTRHREATTVFSSYHLLIGSPLSKEGIEAAAAAQGWQTQRIETGLFEVTKVWVDGAILLEFLVECERERYVAAFGVAGMSDLDGELRKLEVETAKALATKLTTEQISNLVGEGV